MRILVTGGAGYVGSAVAAKLIEEGYDVVVLDNLEQGHRDAVPAEAQFALADIRDPQSVEEVFQRYNVDAIMHMAAETVVEYSMTRPERYFQNNVVGGLNLLEAALSHGVRKFIFSSSAAVYGEPQAVPIEEDHPKAPVNAYGESKLMFEHILRWYGKAHGLRHISFRYFNAAGAGERLGEDHNPETHLIPNVLRAALNESNPVSIYGSDYPTADGSCVRDYVHVRDIARAHVLALARLETAESGAYNLGNGDGYSVLDVIRTAQKVSGRNIPIKTSPRRAGDPAVLVASSKLAREELGWEPQFPSLEKIIETAWTWLREHPSGYER